jgi:hypothetical protein
MVYRTIYDVSVRDLFRKKQRQFGRNDRMCCDLYDTDSERYYHEISANTEVYTWLTIHCGALVFFMQEGFALITRNGYTV